MRFFKTLIFILFSSTAFAQTYPQHYFINPLSIPLVIAGNFGEPRADHFHTGIDFTTHKQTKLKVFATAAGYVSRIKVSAVGYGNAIYITHPNGYMTVYGHLDHFAPNIQEYVRKNQYAKESFEAELYPDKNLFPVKQGEVIAYSGNSGGSSAPHLHYEIRDATGESFPLNPLAFGLTIQDNITPKFQSLLVYSLESDLIQKEPKNYKVYQTEKKNFIKPDTILTDHLKIGFGVEASDWMNGSDSDGDFGIYSLSASMDGKQFYSFQFDRLDFAEGRYANCLIDYKEELQNRRLFYRTYLFPGNEASIYKDVLNKGVIELKDNDVHEVIVTAKDFSGNTSLLKFHIRYQRPANPFSAFKTINPFFFSYNKPNKYSTDSIRIDFPERIFYYNYNFLVKVDESRVKNSFSPTYSCGDPFIPLHKQFTISILPKNLPETLKSKALIEYIGTKGGRGKTSEWDGNYITTKSFQMGQFRVVIDTVPPKIICINAKQNQLLKTSSIDIKITDEMSGIAKYNGYLDDKWTLMEYDAKNDLLTFTSEKTLSKGEHSLKVVVEDEVKNKSSFILKFKQ